MTNKGLISKFVDIGMIGEKMRVGSMQTNSMRIDGNYLLSYDTPIAKWNGKFFEVAKKKYSVTTSKQQTYVRSLVPDGLMVEVDEIRDDGQFPWRR